MPKVVVQLVMMFARQGNMKALRKLSGQFKLPVKDMINKARSLFRYDKRHDAIARAKQLGTKPPPRVLQEKLNQIKNNPEMIENVMGNMQKAMRHNIKKYRK
tara:strand:- start:13986 stop:14291 length:306 start_codon:yes stop_codon:yes gene_type:complete